MVKGTPPTKRRVFVSIFNEEYFEGLLHVIRVFSIHKLIFSPHKTPIEAATTMTSIFGNHRKAELK